MDGCLTPDLHPSAHLFRRHRTDAGCLTFSPSSVGHLTFSYSFGPYSAGGGGGEKGEGAGGGGVGESSKRLNYLDWLTCHNMIMNKTHTTPEGRELAHRTASLN